MFKLWLLLGCFGLELLLGTTNDLQPQCFKVEDEKCPNSNISYLLYSDIYPNGLKMNPYNLREFFTPPMPLKVLIHGLSGNRNSSPNAELRPELLLMPEINVLTVDYGLLTPDPCYIESVHNIRIVARCLAELLIDLIKINFVHSDDIHLIGFGLGAHGAAFTANEMEKMHIRVSHISALNPSKAMFLTPDLTERLDPSDADFVDVIHTDIFVHGLMQPVGHVDFYPNKGVVQPNCGPIDDIGTHDCYQTRSAEYYAESIHSPDRFWAFICKDLYDFVVGECKPSHNVEELGYHTPNTARGTYFLSTNEKPPYARGMNFEKLDRKLDGKTYMPNVVLEKLSESMIARDLTTHI